MMTLAYLVLAAALVAMQKPAPASDEMVKKVRIVIAELASLEQQCKGGKFQTVDILVEVNPKQNVPFHCRGSKLLSHGEAHKYEDTILILSYDKKESALWYSDTEFTIASIAPHEDKDAASAPKNPFQRPFPTKPSKAVESGLITKESIGHRYKISLQIGERKIDPDLWCNP